MASDKNKWIQEYEKVRPMYVHFTERLMILIKELIERKGIPYHVIEPRTKSVKSFGEKITRPDKHYADPIDEITDLSGIRIIVYYLDDVDKVAKLVKDEFSISQKDSVDKTTILKPHEFGYLAIHYVVGLSKKRKALPEWKDFRDLKAEIQIRTVLQHAWASIDQALRYKKEADVPYQFRRKLFRLSGILELADEEFTSLKTGIVTLRSTIRDRIEKEDIDLEINVDTLEEYTKSATVQRLTEFAKSVKGAEVKVIRTPKRDLSELVSFCSALGLSKVSELDSFLKSVIDDAPAFYEDLAKEEDREIYEWVLTVPYLVIYLIIGAHPKLFLSKKQKKLIKDFNKDFIKKILKYGQIRFASRRHVG